MPSYVYTADDGDRKSIRLSADRATAGGFAEGATDDDDSVKVSKTNREFGMRPRGVRGSRNIGSEEEPNMRYTFLPVATEALFNGAAYSKGATFTTDGETYTITSKVAENAR